MSIGAENSLETTDHQVSLQKAISGDDLSKDLFALSKISEEVVGTPTSSVESLSPLEVDAFFKGCIGEVARRTQAFSASTEEFQAHLDNLTSEKVILEQLQDPNNKNTEAVVVISNLCADNDAGAMALKKLGISDEAVKCGSLADLQQKMFAKEAQQAMEARSVSVGQLYDKAREIRRSRDQSFMSTLRESANNILDRVRLETPSKSI